jgi:hypothetical protein
VSFLNNNDKFLYIHIPKCGGVSMMTSLYSSGLSNDIKFGKWPVVNQFSSKVLKRLPVTPVRKKAGLSKLRGLELLHSGHVSYMDFEQNITDIDDYTVFTVVRNPYDWLVSLFTFVNKVKSHPYKLLNPERFSSFENFIQYQCRREASQLSYIRNSLGTIEGVKIFKLETIFDSYSALTEIIGTRFVGMEKKNTSEHRHYSMFYTDSLKELVDEAYEQDLKDLNYQFSYR